MARLVLNTQVLTRVQMAEMEDCEGVIATERYGSQESWKYLLKDRRMKRQKDAVDGTLAGNSVSGVFKVRDSFRKAIMKVFQKP